MSANVHGHKRPYSAGSGKGEPTSKFAKTATSGYVKRDKPPYHSATPSFGKTASKKPFVNGGARAPKQDLEQRRKRPITAAGGEVDDEEGNEQEDGDEAMEVDGGEGEVDGPAEKRPRMTKDERAALHAAQPHRTALLPSHPLLHDKLLPLWEKARRADLSKEERKKAVAELWDSVKGRVGEVSRGHKGGRVLQTIVKYGGKEERLGVAMELRPQWRDMMESKYSKFLMSKLIRYCPQIRPLLIPALSSHLSSLLAHAHAVQPLSDFFDLYASSRERRLLVRGFYPREVMIFDGAKEGAEAKGLEGTLEGMGEGKGKERVLDGVEKVVLDLFNATQKTALAQGIFHNLVREYLACIYRFLPLDQADKKMRELLTAAAESLPDIVHTKDGSAVVQELIARGNAKDRKQILQPLRKHIPAMCKDADAQMVLFTAFDCVDDTKLVGKAFVSDITAMAYDLVSDKNGRRVLLYLLDPTSNRHFISSTLSTLSMSAQAARDAGTSKKDPVVRRKELLGYASEGFLKLVEENGEELVRDPGAGLVVQEIMLHAEGDKSAAIRTLVLPLQTPYPECAPTDTELDPSSSHLLDLPHSTRTYKLFLSGGHFDTSTRTLAIPDTDLPRAFAFAFWEAITCADAGGDENAVRIAKGNAPFVVVEMAQALVSARKVAEIKRILGRQHVITAIRASGRKGARLLAEKLAAL